MECNLFVADIAFAEGMGIAAQSQLRPYEAISYSWGRPERTAVILCNGVQIKVPPTLAEALQYLRLGSLSRWLWCDAICINQDDDIEKSNQVQMMLTIFAKAMRVVAWRSSPEHSVHSDAELVGWMSTRVWWHRQKVVQEIFAACSLILQAGHSQFQPESFVIQNGFEENFETRQTLKHCSDLLEYYEKVRFDPFFSGASHALASTAAGSVPALADIFGPTEKGEPERAAEVFCHELSRAAKRHVSDPRDRIYAVMGILNNEFRNRFDDFPIDCRKTVSEVFQDLTKYLINHGIGISLLGYQRHGEVGHDLPLWVLDLRQPLPDPQDFRWRQRTRRYPEQQGLSRKDEFVLPGRCGAILGQPIQSLEIQSLEGSVPDGLSWEVLTSFRSAYRSGTTVRECHKTVISEQAVCLTPSESKDGDLVVYLAGHEWYDRSEANFVPRLGREQTVGLLADWARDDAEV